METTKVQIHNNIEHQALAKQSEKKQASQSDSMLHKLQYFLQQGGLKHCSEVALFLYKKVKDEWAGLALRGSRIVIPTILQDKMRAIKAWSRLNSFSDPDYGFQDLTNR